MERFFRVVDRILTAILLVLVTAMVLSITAEIALNAIVQPVSSSLIESLCAGSGAIGDAIPAEGGEAGASRWAPLLEGVATFVARSSAPVNTISQTLLVWVGVLGSALAFRRRSHLGVDALVRLYPPRVRLYLDYVSTALVGVFSLCVLVIGGWLVAHRAFSLGSKMPGLERFNRGWFYLVLVIAGVLTLIYCHYHFLHPAPVGSDKPPGEERSDS